MTAPGQRPAPDVAAPDPAAFDGSWPATREPPFCLRTTVQRGWIRWGVRLTLVAGVSASVAANILHALDNPISQTIAAWPPLALLLTVELISRVPVDRAWLGIARLAATAIIAGIAGWVSYWHMTAVAARYGETGASPYLLPLSVDGLVVVASICLVELSDRTPTRSNDREPGTPPSPPAAPGTAPPPQPGRPSTPAEPAHHARPAPTGAVVARVSAGGPRTPGAKPIAAGDVTAYTSTPTAGAVAKPAKLAQAAHPGTSDDVAVPEGIAAAVAYWRHRDPQMTLDDLAQRVGRSPRQVRRYLQAPHHDGQDDTGNSTRQPRTTITSTS